MGEQLCRGENDVDVDGQGSSDSAEQAAGRRHVLLLSGTDEGDGSDFVLEEESVGRYPSLEMTQRAALSSLARDIVSAVRDGLESGRYVVQEGVVRLAEPAAIREPVAEQSCR